jgi:hypothetical protein
MALGVDEVDRDIARDSILKTSRKLAVGGEARLDRNVVSSAFPPGIDERAVEMQIVDFLKGLGDGVFACRPIVAGVDGDFVVRRQSEAPLSPELKPAAVKAPRRKRPRVVLSKPKATKGRARAAGKPPVKPARRGPR